MFTAKASQCPGPRPRPRSSESEKMFAQCPSAPRHVTSLNPSKIALAYHATVTQCTDATKKAKQHLKTGLNLFIRHFCCRRVWFLKKCLIDSYQCCVYKTSHQRVNTIEIGNIIIIILFIIILRDRLQLASA